MLSADGGMLGELLATGEVVAMDWYGQQAYASPGRWLLSLDGISGPQDSQVISAQALLAAGGTQGDVGASPVTLDDLGVVRQLGRDGLFLLESADDVQYVDILSVASALPGFQYIEPGFAITVDSTFPDDSMFDSLCGLHNTGQTGGTPDADIDAPEPWDIHTGTGGVIVGVIDTGVDYARPGLAANMWHNPGEIDGDVDADDIDLLFAAYGSGVESRFDLNGDGNADADDVDMLVHDILDTEYGDLNLNGQVTATDLAIMAAGFGQAGGWADGDVNGNGLVTATDLANLQAHFGFARPVAPNFDGQVCALEPHNATGELISSVHFLAGDPSGVGAAPLPDDGALPETPGTASFDLAETYLLHSNPGGTKTIYLDFDGHTTVGTSWNSAYTGGDPIVTPEFNFEGYDTSTTEGEMIRIQEIWEQVAEDFAPFDVDVTTEEPADLNDLIRDWSDPADERWGVRAVLGGSSGWTGSGYYGLGYYGSFYWQSDTPVFIFTGGTGSNVNKVATVASHEIGHALNLYHDGKGSGEYYSGHGSGETGWAPIMGSGWNKSLNQWSKGEYDNATNTQDDLAIITNGNNGINYRTDDHGGDLVSASSLVIQSDATVFDSGIIEQNTDLDFFSFTTLAGTINLDIDPFYRGPNLDVLATLYDSVGAVVATSNPLDYLDASFSLSLAAGTYYLSVDGTSKPDPAGYTDYGSLGQYTITGSIITPGVKLTETAGDTLVSEGKLTDTYDVALTTVPAGAVEITATADAETELSLDGVNFSSSVVFSRADMTPQTITIRAIDDAVVDAIDTSTITHAITATADATDYPLSTDIFDLGLNVIDDDVPRIIDDDDVEAYFDATNFDYEPSPYWTGYLTDNHVNQPGTGTAEATWTFVGVSDGNYRVSTTWRDRPDRATDAPFTIANGSDLTLMTATLDQTQAANDFTDAGGDWEDLGIVTSLDGTLVIKLNESPGATGKVMADGMRIERIGGLVTLLTVDIAAVSILETGGSTTGSVMRTGDLVGDMTVTLASDNTLEATVPATVVIADGQAVAEFTVTVLDESLLDGTKTVTFTASAAGVSDATDQLDIEDNEVGPAGIIIDDGDAGFAQTNFTYVPDPSLVGHETDVHINYKNTGSAEASWTFTGLDDGHYWVSATWREKYNRATDTPYTIDDGSGGILANVVIDQKVRPNDLEEAGSKWEGLSTVTITGGTLVVTVNESPGGTGMVLADAVRVQRVGDIRLPGDFNGDTVVDDLDIDLLFANAGNSDYDLDSDGDADADDVNTLLHNILSTEYADFNLDGQVTATDLAILATGYGQAGGWASGDANGDGMVTATDLALLEAHFGFTPAPI